jgi:hypothetical protein
VCSPCRALAAHPEEAELTHLPLGCSPHPLVSLRPWCGQLARTPTENVDPRSPLTGATEGGVASNPLGLLQSSGPKRKDLWGG